VSAEMYSRLSTAVGIPVSLGSGGCQLAHQRFVGQKRHPACLPGISQLEVRVVVSCFNQALVPLA